MSIGLLMPGQGSQSVGMGKSLSNSFESARLVFEEVDNTLNKHLSRIMFDGPLEELTLTQNTQPALMATSVAVARVIKESGGDIFKNAKYLAGHSLGEYSALVINDSLKLSDAAKLLDTRGKAMQESVPLGQGAMAALIGANIDQAIEIASLSKDTEVCQVANDNAPGQVVISGTKAAIDRAISISKEKGVRKTIILPVSAPFHCSLMLPAAEKMAKALEEVTFSNFKLPIISNVTAKPEFNSENIKKLLVEQVTKMVRWRETINYMVEDNVDYFMELGSGKVLAGLVKRISPDCSVLSLQEPNDLDSLFKKIL
ncbi:MAG: [acyl-carrier-protein] S-malonyltransferase [Rhodospirillaceae bacterium]|nr:[acyl-carrier-protein] S-malonyltransferase [Rhodospirillaceae bacterium]|tara:strand:+ start:1157 stop:2098 length:942 start_codon:yes stop_codon:yes gene_type:complete